MTSASPASTRASESTHWSRESKQVTPRDGRRIGYAEFGAAGGRPVPYCHGFPCSRLDGRLGHEVALRLGLHLIAPDRPGYGLSDYQPHLRLRAPCHLWHGEQDTTVPVEMGRWLARSVPGCRSNFFPDDGHFSLPVNRIDGILEALAAAQ